VSIDARLSRLSPALSARERAILVLNAWKEGKEDEPSWRSTMPQNQAHEFNRLIALMNAANREVATLIRLLKQSADECRLRFAWLTSLVLWQEHVDEIRRAIRVAVREPISEAEYAVKVAKFREEWVDIEELAGVLAGDAGGWTEDDYEEDEDGALQVKDEAWNRVCAEKERWLRDRVADGSLPAKGKGRRLKVQEGAFDDLVGRPSGACPEGDGHLLYQVVADEYAEQVKTDRDLLRRLQRVLEWKPFYGPEKVDLPQMPEYMLGALKQGLALLMVSTWTQLRSVEVVLDEMAPEFDGIDPLRPLPREALNDAKTGLLSLQKQLRAFDVEVDLREPLDEELEEMREWVRDRTR
jgi:hypothetical protein